MIVAVKEIVKIDQQVPKISIANTSLFHDVVILVAFFASAYDRLAVKCLHSRCRT